MSNLSDLIDAVDAVVVSYEATREELSSGQDLDLLTRALFRSFESIGRRMGQGANFHETLSQLAGARDLRHWSAHYPALLAEVP